MMKNYVPYLLGLIAAISDDIAAWYPEDATEWRRTQARLRSLVNTRGLRYLTIDLVAAGKHFDQCLERGSFFPSMIPGFRVRRGEAVPRLFAGLLLRVFTKRGKLRIDADVTAISFLRQLFFTAKRTELDCNDSTTFKAVAEFFSIEREVRAPRLNWRGDLLLDDHDTFPEIHISDGCPDSQTGSDPGQYVLDLKAARTPLENSAAIGTSLKSRYPGLLDTIQRVADLVSSDLGLLNRSEICPRHGPGAVSDQRGESKYDFPNWPPKLEVAFPAVSFGSYNEGGFWDRVVGESEVRSYEPSDPPSKLIAVPKTLAAPRLIASEPISHQWIQQGILSTFVERMEATLLANCVSVRDQRPSRELALLASVSDPTFGRETKDGIPGQLSRGSVPNRSVSLATVDLKEASDRVSCWLVERIFRRNLSFLSAFHAVRTRWLVNKIDKRSPRYTLLRKFTTMGSALTFPVQSYIYAVVCIGVDLYFRESLARGDSRTPKEDLSRVSAKVFRKNCELSSTRVRVFGDDIIHPVESLSILVDVLTYIGLKVNPAKTFWNSKFRESCGVDAYAGYEVHPTYVNEIPDETKPESLFSVLEASNNFFMRGCWHASEYLRNSLPKWFEKAIPVKKVGSGASGFCSFVGARVPISHWNTELQRAEYTSYLLVNKSKKQKIRGSSALLQYFTERPDPLVKWESGVVPRALPQLRKRGFPLYDLI